MTTILQKLEITTQVTFPRLRELRGKYQITYDAMAKAMGANKQQTAIKRMRDGDFTIDEMVAIRDFFNAMGETETITSLFFDWLSTNVK